MVVRAFTMRVDEEILQAFDRVAWERRMTRTALLTELMRMAARPDFSVPEGWPEAADMVNARKRQNAVVERALAERAEADGLIPLPPLSKQDEARAILMETAARLCPHPKDRRKKFAWGSKCEACDSIVK